MRLRIIVFLMFILSVSLSYAQDNKVRDRMEDLMKEMEEEKTETTPAKTETTPEGIEITPEGGEYTLPNGIKIIAPEGAVTTKTNIDVTLIDKSDEKIIAFYQSREESIDNYYICFDAKPDGISFQKPINVILPSDINPGEIPFAYRVDLNTYSYSPALTNLIVNLSENTISVSLDHFSPYLLEKSTIEGVRDLIEKFCRDNPCACKDFSKSTQIEDVKAGCGGITDCELKSLENIVYFTKDPCGENIKVKTEHEWQYSEECEPVLILTAADTKIPTGRETTIRANINICGIGVENQKVTFEVLDSTLGSINPDKPSTDTGGNAITTFKADDKEGIVTITANADVEWHLENHIINGVRLPNSEPPKQKHLSESIDITITDKWSGTADFKYVMNFVTSYSEAHIDATYKAEFEFRVTKEEAEPIWVGKRIKGSAKATQNVSYVMKDPYVLGVNVNAPPILDNLIVEGFVDENNYLHMGVVSPDEEGFFTVDVIGTEETIRDLIGYPIGVLPIGAVIHIPIGDSTPGGRPITPSNSIPLKEGIYRVEFSETPYSKWIYTVTLKGGT